jgi:putative phage-type endonuclease
MRHEARRPGARLPEWHAHRAQHFNASDAPAMLGVSPHISRSRLLRDCKTFLTADPSAFQERIFNAGHRYEAQARPLAEAILGEELFACVGVLEGTKLSASFDGITLLGDTIFEHKTLNDDLREAIARANEHGEALPEPYRVQMEQQLLVSGASRALFMASKWDADGNLVDEAHCWYSPEAALRQRIVAGWAQFEADLAALEPEPAAKPVATGRTPEALPALRIEVTGMVTASNLAEFKSHALAVLGSINRDLRTDDDFADAEQTVKWCKAVEDRLEAAKVHALSQTASIEELFRTVRERKRRSVSAGQRAGAALDSDARAEAEGRRAVRRHPGRARCRGTPTAQAHACLATASGSRNPTAGQGGARDA